MITFNQFSLLVAIAFRRTSVALMGCVLLAAASLAQALPTITLEEVASGFQTPVELVNSGDGSGRLFVVEQGGKIKILSSGVVNPTPFLDISTIVLSGGERGLLGLAFHPQYSTNNAFYVYYTRAGDGALTIARYLRSATNNLQADPASGAVILTIPHPNNANHNGGHLAFGRDGYLYIGTGDGGGGGDPDKNGQNLSTLLGKMLRISVNGGTAYTIPSTNPYATSSCVGAANACPEVWAFGLRNPWKFSFDRSNGDLFIGDVGQGAYEEVDYVPAGASNGKNFGWNVFEGLHCYGATTCGIASGLAPHTPPVIEYGHDSTDFGGFSITGGYRHRGTVNTTLNGYYFYGDYVSKRLWVAAPNANGVWTPEFSQIAPSNISSFGEDESGELYLVAYASGKIYAIKGAVVPVARVLGDLSGDGKSDLLVQSTSGTTTAWLMNGTAISSAANLIANDPNWTLTHTADFNGDGKADLLWRHTDGRVAMWLMNGTALTSGAGLLEAASGWTVTHVADFNGDGKADILFRHTDGRIAMWLMNGTALTSGAGLLEAASGWAVTHVADFNGDGKADILFRHTDGRIAMWLMNGTALTNGAGLLNAASGWTAIHTADFNGDGKADILFQHTDGRIAMWLMNGTALTNGAGLLEAASGWTATHTGDFNGDGKADIHYRHTDGRIAMWLMNGTTLTSGAGLLEAASGWTVTHTGDFNGDGKADVLYRHADGRIAMWLMNGITLTSGAGLTGTGTLKVVP